MGLLVGLCLGVSMHEYSVYRHYVYAVYSVCCLVSIRVYAGYSVYRVFIGIIFMQVYSVYTLGGGRGGTPPNFGWGCAAQFSKPYFRPKYMIFQTPFQT